MAETTRPRGLYFEEFETGYTVETPSRTITEADVTLFAGLSGDYNQLHTDVEFAQGALFGERIAHGLLVLSIASGLASRLGLIEGTTLAFTGLEWKFRAPVKFGDTVRVRLAVKQKKAMRRLGGGFVFFAVSILNQRDEIVQKGVWKVLLKSAPSVPL